jgi:protein TonB
MLHAVGALALVALPLLLTASLPEAGSQVHAFFVEPMLAPPPPPPPPPPAVARPASARVEPQPASESSGRFTAPVSVPDELRLEEGLDLGFEGGLPGGVDGGVPGGVVGGIVGGLPESISAPPPPVTPLRVGGQVKDPVKVKHVDPVYPRVAADASIQGVVVIEAVIDSTGQVTQAVVLSGVPLLNEAALDAVRRWQYSPTLVNGIPTPIVLVITVTFQLKPAAAI